MAERRTTAGNRSYLVTIVAPAQTLAVDETVIEANVPAAIIPWSVASIAWERLAGGGIQNQTNYTVNVGYRTDVLPSYVIVEQGGTERRMQIVNVIPTARRDELNMTCVTNG